MCEEAVMRRRGSGDVVDIDSFQVPAPGGSSTFGAVRATEDKVEEDDTKQIMDGRCYIESYRTPAAVLPA